MCLRRTDEKSLAQSYKIFGICYNRIGCKTSLERTAAALFVGRFANYLKSGLFSKRPYREDWPTEVLQPVVRGAELHKPGALPEPMLCGKGKCCSGKDSYVKSRSIFAIDDNSSLQYRSTKNLNGIIVPDPEAAFDQIETVDRLMSAMSVKQKVPMRNERLHGL